MNNIATCGMFSHDGARKVDLAHLTAERMMTISNILATLDDCLFGREPFDSIFVRSVIRPKFSVLEVDVPKANLALRPR